MAKRITKPMAKRLVGQTFEWRGDPARIMAVAENWVMARKHGAVPFIVHASRLPEELLKQAEGREGKERWLTKNKC